MKNCKIVLALVLTMALLCGCGAGVKAEDLAGQWLLNEVCPEDEVTYLMDMIELYDEERTYVDMGSLDYAMIASFDAEGNYSFVYDVDANKDCVRRFYAGVVEDLYENRMELIAVYGDDVENMTLQEFRDFYALMYGFHKYDDMMTQFVENAYDYAVLAEPLETGTFQIVGTSLLCTVTGETESESLGFELQGDTLKLIYADGEEVYTRAK